MALELILYMHFHCKLVVYDVREPGSIKHEQ